MKILLAYFRDTDLDLVVEFQSYAGAWWDPFHAPILTSSSSVEMAGGAAGGFVSRAFESMLKECSGKKYPDLQKAIQSYIGPQISFSFSFSFHFQFVFLFVHTNFSFQIIQKSSIRHRNLLLLLLTQIKMAGLFLFLIKSRFQNS